MCGTQDKVTLKTGVDNLNNDVLVGESHNQAVLRCVAAELLVRLDSLVERVDTYYLFLAWVTSRLRA